MRKIQHVELSDFSSDAMVIPFAADPQATASALRRLAQQFERGEVVMMKSAMNHLAPRDDWQTTTLVLTYVRKSREA